MSEQNKKNQASNSSEGSATYAKGSINMRVHRKRVVNELGTEPTYTVTFERTLQKKDKTWTGDRAQASKEKYDEPLMSTASGSGGDGVAASEPSVNSRALWVEASDGIKRRKIFEMGSLSRVYTMQAAATSSSNAAVSRRTRFEEQMASELSQLKHLLVKKMDENIRVLVKMDEQIRVLKQQIQLVMRHLNLDHNEVPPIPPTNPIGDGHNDEQSVTDDDDDFVSPC